MNSPAALVVCIAVIIATSLIDTELINQVMEMFNSKHSAIPDLPDVHSTIPEWEKYCTMPGPPWFPKNNGEMRTTHECFSSRPHPTELDPVVQEFKQLIEDDPVVRMEMTLMIQQIPAQCTNFHPKDVDAFLRQINWILNWAPVFVSNEGHNPMETAIVGVPLSYILVWTMGTEAGLSAYRRDKINNQFQKLLHKWTQFLDSADSRYVITDQECGWQTEEAKLRLHMEWYEHDPHAEYWGFSSWNDFFRRNLNLTVNPRPIDCLSDDSCIVSACDSQLTRDPVRNVNRSAEFWIKEQPYSLSDMLGSIGRKYVDYFVGGDVYQAFLNSYNYHHWHSPVKGTIIEAGVQQGSYFSLNPSIGLDWTAGIYSQPYITQVQTRAIIVINATAANIGLVVLMPVGMGEISSCKIYPSIKPGVQVEKGQDLGYFQFGGSTHVLLFRKGAINHFIPKHSDKEELIKVGEKIAIAN